jgi:transcription initiation factor TFIID subunit 8
MAGMKRPNATDEPPATADGFKRRKVHHQLLHKQPSEAGPLPGPQDHTFYGAQLIRAIGLALVAVGFESVKPTALESFRAEVEECKLRSFPSQSSR